VGGGSEDRLHLNSTADGQVKRDRSGVAREMGRSGQGVRLKRRRIQISSIRSEAHDISSVIYTVWHRIEMQMKSTAEQDLPLIGNL